jgi:hypothetical protein
VRLNFNTNNAFRRHGEVVSLLGKFARAVTSQTAFLYLDELLREANRNTERCVAGDRVVFVLYPEADSRLMGWGSPCH